MEASLAKSKHVTKKISPVDYILSKIEAVCRHSNFLNYPFEGYPSYLTNEERNQVYLRLGELGYTVNRAGTAYPGVFNIQISWY